MADLTPTATIKLDGKDYVLRGDLNAFADFERVSGKRIMQGGLDFATLEVADVRALLWACMVQENESLTERDVGRMIHVRNVNEISGVLQNLFEESMPEGEDDGRPLPVENGQVSTG